MSEKTKKVPRLRFPEFTDTWEQCKLGDIAKYKNGKAHENSIIESGEYIVVNSKFISTNGEIRKYTNKIIEPLYKNEITFVLSDVPNGKALAKTYLIEENDRYTLNQRIAGITPKNKVQSIFLNLKLNRNSYFLKFDDGSKQTNLSKSDVLNYIDNYPSILEQEKIGNFFKTFDDLITIHQRKLENLKKQKKSLLQKMFPKNGSNFPEIRFPEFTDAWEQCKFKEIGNIKMNKRIFKEETTLKGEIPFYKIGTFGSKADAYISKKLFLKYKELYPYPSIGDILISASGSIGKTVEYKGEEAYFQDSNIIWFDHSGNLKNKFLLYLYEIIKWEGIEGSTIKRLYNSTFLNTQFFKPSLPEQEKIGNFFKSVDDLITIHQCKLENLKKLKKGLLQQMFI